MSDVESSIKSFNAVLENIKDAYKMNIKIDISDRHKIMNAITDLQNALTANPKNEDYIYLRLSEIEDLADTVIIEEVKHCQLRELRPSVDRLINDIFYHR